MTREQLETALRHRLTRPATARELLQLLGVGAGERVTARRLLRTLVRDGVLEVVRGERYRLAQTAPAPTVTARGEATRVGRFARDRSGLAYVVPFDARMTSDILIPRGEHGQAQPGDMVVVAVRGSAGGDGQAIGRVTEVLGDPEAPGVDVAVVLRAFGIADHHSAAAEADARRLGHEVRPEDVVGRTDFRSQPVVTIDGEHARDFDDAVTVEPRGRGGFRLTVHVADVAHYVRPGTALDAEGLDRSTSVYFPDRAVHMFPEALATGLCSLRPEVDRLVQSCVMDVTATGEVERYTLHDGVIRSAARMTYTAVNAILTGSDPGLRERYASLVPMFEAMHALYAILRDRRTRRGAIDFDLPEPDIVLDAEGLVEAILPAERNVAHRLIEEFMLLANETVAHHLESHGMPALYRIHEAPDPLKVEDFEAFLQPLGFRLVSGERTVHPRDFQRLAERVRGTPAERAVALLMLRTMQKARYEAENVGHFGLAAPVYTHFTSPIRRYPDLVVHRALRALRQEGLSGVDARSATAMMAEVGRHTSERERRAIEAERALVQWKKARFMASRLGERFDGFVTGVVPFGLFVELVEHYVEGLVPVATMADDDYHFQAATHTLVGLATGRRYRLGDRVQVEVVGVDLRRRQVELGLVSVLDAMGRLPRRRPERKGVRLAGDSPARHTPFGTRTSTKASRKATPSKRRSAARPGRRERALGRNGKGRKGRKR